MSTKGPKGSQFEANRRRYWSNRSEVIDVFRDTFGPTDLAVIFKREATRESKVLVIEAKENGYLPPKHRKKLEEFLDHKPENVELRIEFLRNLEKSRGHSNTTYTTLKSHDDFERHAMKINRLRKSE